MEALMFTQPGEEAAVLTFLLQRSGFSVRTMQDLDEAIDSWPDQPPDLILIASDDIPAGGLAAVRQLRAHTVVPMLVIADRLPDDLHYRLLDAGVDLVILKPYSIRVLTGQITALMRRAAGVPFYSLPSLTQAGVTLDPATRTVQVLDQEVKRLTQLEFRLLYTLMTHRGQIIPAENLIEHVWGYSGEGSRELVRGLVQRLRSKVEPEPHRPRFILTEPGIGYQFQP
jgi:DNA-binding response OmpR family regulator